MNIRFDYTFRDPQLLLTAMTHRSYIREKRLPYDACNERLEFLGDSLLNYITAEHLFGRFPDREEGELTKLRALVVCEEALNIVAASLGISAALRLGHGEDMNGGRKRASILADAVEAYIAAVYLDGGMEEVRRLVLFFIPELVDRAEAGKLRYADNKTVLQELIQQKPGDTLRYEILSAAGPDHDRIFTAGVFLNDVLCAEAQGRSKKEAQQAAAGLLLSKIRSGEIQHSEA